MFDQLVIDRQIYSLERDGEKFSAMAIDHGKIMQLYENDPANPASLAKTVIDAQGKAVIPAFIDAHCHFMSTAALQEMALNVSEIKNGKMFPDCLDGVREKLQKFAANRNPKLPIICFNYIIASMKENRLPNKVELDAWVPNRTIIVLSMDAHSSSYSSLGLKRMGFDPQQHDGILVGEDHEFNIGKMDSIIMGALSSSTLIKGVQHLISDLIDHGILGVHCLDGLKRKQRSFIMVSCKICPDYSIISTVISSIIRGSESYSVHEINAISANGGMLSMGNGWEIGSRPHHFMSLSEKIPIISESLLHSFEEVESNVPAGYKEGFQITSHAIGTKGIACILSAFNKILHENNDLNNKFRNRIDHFEFPVMEQVDKAVDELHLLFTAQPGYSVGR